MTKKIATKKTATKKTTAKKRPGVYGVVKGWGIATTNADGTVELLATAEGRLAIREIKRRSYAGPKYVIVQITASMVKYTK